jgi:hypothetical protein
MDEIERLEQEIENLREAIERSRRFALAGRASVVAGPALLVGILIGLVGFTPARAVIALAVAIGGMVLSGSSRATTDELSRALARVEAARNAAIDGLELRCPLPKPRGRGSNMGQFSAEKPVAPRSAFRENQHPCACRCDPWPAKTRRTRIIGASTF